MRALCSIDGCEKPSSSHGWCGMHVQRWRRNGDPLVVTRRTPAAKRLCVVEGCGNPLLARDLCGMHYARWRKWGDPLIVHTFARLMEKNPMWGGDDVSYATIHSRIKKTRGSAADLACVDCGARADGGWSYEHGCADERRGLVNGRERPYCPHLDHFHPRCRSCHALYDHAHSPERGAVVDCARCGTSFERQKRETCCAPCRKAKAAQKHARRRRVVSITSRAQVPPTAFEADERTTA